MNSTNGAGQSSTDLRTLDQEQFTNASPSVGGWLWQYNRIIVGVEGDYYFGSRTSRDPRFLVPEGCSAGVMQTGNFGFGAAAPFGSFQTKAHIRGIAGWEFTPRFMGFVAGGLAIGELGPGGIQAGGIIANSPSNPSAGSVSSNYGRQYLYGYSWGGGVQAKLDESLVGRLEYLRDSYNGPGQPSVTSSNTAGTSNVTVTTNPQTMRIVNQALRASLIYRFDPNVPFYEAAQRDFAEFGRFEGSGNAFAGFYAGVGISQNNYDYGMGRRPRPRPSTTRTPRVSMSARYWDGTLSGGGVGKNFLIGYRFPAGRLVLGAEREFVRGSRKNLDQYPGHWSVSPARARISSAIPSSVPPTSFVSAWTPTTGAVETRGRFRGVTGLEITPSLLAFAGYGRAYGRARGTSGSSQGIVWMNASGRAPGRAPRPSPARSRNDISGHTFGGGIEFKATEDIIFRADYWRDHLHLECDRLRRRRLRRHHRQHHRELVQPVQDARPHQE